MKTIEMIQKLSILHCMYQMIASADGAIDEERDQAAIEILDVAGEALAAMAVSCVNRLELFKGKISFGGGVFKSRLVKNVFAEIVMAELPDAEIIAPRFGPEVGALLLAYRQAEQKITPKLLANIATAQTS